jgi:8-oxo-dGTP pyrophosphatase MutT (NUDIX family)
LTSASQDPAAGEPIAKNQDGNGAARASVTSPVSAEGVPDWLAPLARAAAHMPVPAALRPPAGRGRAAAVLILFGDGPDGPDLLLIERSADLRKHPGQPAFPGGAIDEADGGPVPAALREAQEETGVDPAGVTVLAVMPELYIWRSDFRVTPVLGWWHSPVPVAPGDPAEIAAVVRVPVADLVSPANRIMIRYPDGRAQPAFRVGGLVVWGFTAMVLDRLLALAGWERPWDRDQLTDLPASDRPAGWPLPGA